MADVNVLSDDVNVLSERVTQLEREVVDLKDSVNLAIGTMESKIDLVLQKMTICVAPTPNAATAATTSETARSLSCLQLGDTADSAASSRMLGDQTEPECALVLAAKTGEAVSVRYLLRRGAASDAARVQQGLAEAKTTAVVMAFWEVVPDAVRGDAGKIALLQSAFRGRLEPLVALLDLGVDVNSKDAAGQTALVFAAALGHVACVTELLRRGAHVEAKDNFGWSALHRAAQWDREDCVIALLEAGASKSEPNKYGQTPLELAKSKPIKYLLDNEA